MKSLGVAGVATVAGIAKNGGFLRVTAKCRDSVAQNAATVRESTQNHTLQCRECHVFRVIYRQKRGAAAYWVGGSAFGAYPRPTPRVKPHRGQRAWIDKNSRVWAL